MTDKAKLFTRVAISQLHTRAAGVLKGTASGVVEVCPAFLRDVATITDAILKAAEDYSTKQKAPEPQFLTEARANFQDALDSVVEQNTELLSSLKD